jgi:hypothetical protein
VDQSTFLSVDSRSNDSGTINVLVYDTKAGENSATLRLVDQASRLVGVEASLFGTDGEFEGFGSKYAALYPRLTKMAPDALVIVSDGYDVLINNPANALDNTTPVSQFLAAYKELIANHPNAIVVSAEAQCCVSALTHVLPGGYYNADGSRNARACASGEEGCLWVGDDEAQPWITFMEKKARDNKAKPDCEDLYLNAGLMVGSVKNLMRLIESSAIGKDEDDQAVLTDYMYLHPDEILLDYGQKLFGNNRGAQGKSGCVFDATDADHQRLVHLKTGTTPLFVHSPGAFLQCEDDLSAKLGIVSATAATRRRLQIAAQAATIYSSYRYSPPVAAPNYGKKHGGKMHGMNGKRK